MEQMGLAVDMLNLTCLYSVIIKFNCMFCFILAVGEKKYPWQAPVDMLILSVGLLGKTNNVQLISIAGANQVNTLHGTNTSHLGKRNIIYKTDFYWDMLVPKRATNYKKLMVDLQLLQTFTFFIRLIGSYAYLAFLQIP